MKRQKPLPVPEAVRELARAHDCPFISWVTSDPRGDIFCIAPVEMEGEAPAPTGLPTLIIYRDGACRLVEGMAALELLDTLTDEP